MNPAPHSVGFIHEQIDIVIAASQSPQLAPSQILELTHFRNVPCRIILKQLVLDFFLILHAHAKGDLSPDIIHDGIDVGTHLTGIHIQTNRFVPTSDVKPNPGRTHLIFVGNHSTNGNGIPEMMVCHERTVVRCLLTIENLLNRVVLEFSPNGNSV